MCFAVIENLNCKEEEEGKKKQFAINQPVRDHIVHVCVCVSVQISFCPSLYFFVSVSCTVSVIYL